MENRENRIQRIASLRNKLLAFKGELLALKKQLKRFQVAGEEHSKRKIIRAINSKQKQISNLQSEVETILKDDKKEDVIENINQTETKDIPIVFFPIKLETRFFHYSAPVNIDNIPIYGELILRIFPDAALADMHEPLLTDIERNEGLNYWEQTWNAAIETKTHKENLQLNHSARYAVIIGKTKPNEINGDHYGDLSFEFILEPFDSSISLRKEEVNVGVQFWEEANNMATKHREAWNKIKNKFGANRAAWIIKQTSPVNLNEFKTLNAENANPVFPDLSLRSANTQRLPGTNLLPEKWVIVLYDKYNPDNTNINGLGEHLYSNTSGGETTIIEKALVVETNPVPDQLALSKTLDSNYIEIDPPNGPTPEGYYRLPKSNLAVLEELKWQHDHTLAEELGMAKTVFLDQNRMENGFERIMVFGIKNTLTPEEEVRAVSNLFENHHYSKGWSFVNQGTPSNNTATVESGYPIDDDNGRISFDLERRGISLNPNGDGAIFATALGLDSTIIRNIYGANNQEQINAIAMSRALWPVAMGYYLDHMMAPEFNPDDNIRDLFSDEHVEDGREYYLRYVRGRGPLPAIRIGDVPYGLLPVSPFSSEEYSPYPFSLIESEIRKLRINLLKRPGDFDGDTMDIIQSSDAQRYYHKDLSFVDFFAPRVPHFEVSEVLSMNASSKEYYLRRILGRMVTSQSLGLFPINTEDDFIDTRIGGSTFFDRAELFKYGSVTIKKVIPEINEVLEVLSETNTLDNSPNYFNPDDVRELRTIRVHTNAITKVAFSKPNSTEIITSSKDGTAKVLDFFGNQIISFEEHNGAVNSISCHYFPQAYFAGLLILSVGIDGSIFLWDKEGNLFPDGTVEPQDNNGLSAFHNVENTESISIGQFFNKGSSVLLGYEGGKMKIFNLEGKFIREQTQPGNILSTDTYGNGILLFSSLNTIKRLGSSGSVTQILNRNSNILSFKVGPDNQTLVGGCADGTVFIANIDGNIFNNFQTEHRAVNAVAISPLGRRFLTGGEDGVARLWSISGDLLRTFIGHTGPINSVDFSTDGVHVLTGGEDRLIKIWDTTAGSSQLSINDQYRTNYIRDIREAINFNALGELGDTMFQKPLLFLLLRHGASLEYVEACNRFLEDNQLIEAIGRFQFELHRIERGRYNDPTLWERFQQGLEVLPRGMTLEEHIFTSPAESISDRNLRRVVEYRDSLEILENLPTAELERLMSETLDCFAYRLDAWITSLATKRLEEIRKQQQAGNKIGSYGWLEYIKPICSKDEKSIDSCERENIKEIIITRGINYYVSAYSDVKGGYILAPSINHANAAAVLRNAWLEYGKDNPNRPFAINLSSLRVRKALYLVDVHQQGQPIGAGLGYLFERFIRDYEGNLLDQFIKDFRATFPLTLGINHEQNVQMPQESISSQNVVNGISLWERLKNLNEWKEGNQAQARIKLITTLLGDKLGGDQDPGRLLKINGLSKALIDLETNIDALTDFLISESVFRLVNSDQEAASSLFETMSKGASIPEPLIPKTPKRHYPYTHRTVMVFNPNLKISDYWETKGNLRSRAEPTINGWLGSIFPQADKIHCQAVFEDGTELKVSCKDLLIEPIDFFYAAIKLNEQLEGGELFQRVAQFAINNKRNAPFNLRFIHFELPNSYLQDGEYSMSFVSLICQAVFDLLKSTKALKPHDLWYNDQKNTISENDLKNNQELNLRLNQIIDELEDIQNLLQAESDSYDRNPQNMDDQAVREKLKKASHLGLSSTFPNQTTENHILKSNLDQTLINIKKILSNISSLQLKQEVLVEDILASVFKDKFWVYPYFQPYIPSDNRNNIQHAMETDLDFGESKEEALSKLFTRLSNISGPINALKKFHLCLEAVQSTAKRFDTLLQLPVEPNATWIGASFAIPNLGPTYDSDKNWTRLNIHTFMEGFQEDNQNLSQYFDSDSYISGLLIYVDEDKIPYDRENLAFTFNYDSPGAEAPGTILIATKPNKNRYWSYSMILDTLNQTFDNAKIRGFDGEHPMIRNITGSIQSLNNKANYHSYYDLPFMIQVSRSNQVGGQADINTPVYGTNLQWMPLLPMICLADNRGENSEDDGIDAVSTNFDDCF